MLPSEVDLLRARVAKLEQQLDLVLADARRYALGLDAAHKCRDALSAGAFPRFAEIQSLKDLLRQWLVYESSRELRAETLAALGMQPDEAGAVDP